MKLSNDKPNTIISYTTTANDTQKRLDVVVRHWLEQLALSQIFQAIRKGQIRVNDQKVKASYRLQLSDRITYDNKNQQVNTDNSTTNKTPTLINTSLAKEYQQLAILYEDENLISVNKPNGWITHGQAPSLNSWLEWHFGLSAAVSFERSALHRLDIGTTGVIMLAKTLQGARTFSTLQQTNQLRKLYLAIVEGKMRDNHVRQYQHHLTRHNKKSYAHTTPMPESKLAITNIYPLVKSSDATLVACTIPTGRTHQIRAVCAHLGHPILGDVQYGSKALMPTKSAYHLHSYMLLDASKTLFPCIKAPIPKAFQTTLKDNALSITPNLLDQAIVKLLH